MTDLRLRPAALMLCAYLSGCAAPVAPPLAPAPVAAPAGPVSYDGTYNGLLQLMNGSAFACGNQDVFIVRVASSTFRYVLNQPQVDWRPTITFDLTIGNEGGFQTQSGAAYVRGQVSSGHMQGEIVGDACGFQFEADNSGTW